MAKMKDQHRKAAQELKAAADLANDEKLQDALAALEDDDNARKRAKQDPEGYLKEKGVKLPAGAKVTFDEE